MPASHNAKAPPAIFAQSHAGHVPLPDPPVAESSPGTPRPPSCVPHLSRVMDVGSPTCPTEHTNIGATPPQFSPVQQITSNTTLPSASGLPATSTKSAVKAPANANFQEADVDMLNLLAHSTCSSPSNASMHSASEDISSGYSTPRQQPATDVCPSVTIIDRQTAAGPGQHSFDVGTCDSPTKVPCVFSSGADGNPRSTAAAPASPAHSLQHCGPLHSAPVLQEPVSPTPPLSSKQLVWQSLSNQSLTAFIISWTSRLAGARLFKVITERTKKGRSTLNWESPCFSTFPLAVRAALLLLASHGIPLPACPASAPPSPTTNTVTAAVSADAKPAAAFFGLGCGDAVTAADTAAAAVPATGAGSKIAADNAIEGSGLSQADLLIARCFTPSDMCDYMCMGGTFTASALIDFLQVQRGNDQA